MTGDPVIPGDPGGEVSFAPEPAAAPRRRMLGAQTGMEFRLLLRNGEQVGLTLVIPLLLLFFFNLPLLYSLGYAAPHRLRRPSIIALAVMSASFTGLAIGTGFERKYARAQAARRHGAAPLGAVGAARRSSVLLLELDPDRADRRRSGWPWPGTRTVTQPLVVLLIALGTAAFGGLGLLLAGTLRAEVTLAAANLIWLVLLFAGGIAIPLSKYPHGVREVLQYLPSAALSDGLHQVLQGGARFPDWPGADPGRVGRRRPAVRGPVVPVGLSTEHRVASATGGPRWAPGWLQSATTLRRLALASVVANVVIVVTGGAVRLTNSGLGCPTWPSCTDASLTPTKAYSFHGVIEFTNRQLTFVLAVIAVATWLAAMLRHQERTLATVAALSIPAQALLGGLTVLTHLNPWLVAAHFLFSTSIIATTFWLWWRVRVQAPLVASPLAARRLVRVTVAVTAAVLVLGTVVTGSGPHAGDEDASGKVHRTGLKVASMAQLHADAVMVLIGLSVGVLAVAYALRAGTALRRAAIGLVGVELAQAGIGYTQYFLHVPPLLVALHMFGACLVWLAALWVLMLVEPHARTPYRRRLRAPD